MKWIPYKMLQKICIFPFCKFTKKNMGSILDKFSWIKNIGRQYPFSTKFWSGIFQTFIFLPTKFGMPMISESTTIIFWKCVTTLQTPDITTSIFSPLIPNSGKWEEEAKRETGTNTQACPQAEQTYQRRSWGSRRWQSLWFVWVTTSLMQIDYLVKPITEYYLSKCSTNLSMESLYRKWSI